MTNRIPLLCFSLLFCLAVSAQGTPERVKNRAENRAKNRANNKVDRSVDKAVDEAFEGIGNLFKKRKKKSEASPNERVDDGGLAPNDGEEYRDDEEVNRALGNLFGGGGDFEAFENETTFSLVMKVREVRSNGKEESNQTVFAQDPTHIVMVMSDPDSHEKSRLIFDTQTGKTTTISTDKKGATSGVRMRMPFTAAGAVDDAVQESTGRYQVERTGKTRTIQGYPAEQFIVTDTKTGDVTESWSSKDVGLTTENVFGGMVRMFGGKSSGNTPALAQMPANLRDMVDYFPLETVSTDKKGKKVYMSFEDIRTGSGRVDRSYFDTSGVEIQDLGF